MRVVDLAEALGKFADTWVPTIAGATSPGAP